MSREDHLHRNELEHLSQSVGKWFEKYGLAVLGGICGVIVVAAIIWYVIRSRGDAQAEGWAKLRAALSAAQDTNSPEDLLGLADNANYKGTAIGAWARLTSAEIRLANAVHTQFTDRKAGLTELEQCREDFSGVIRNGEAPEEARERALYGLASTLEALSDGSPDSINTVLKTYQTLLDDFKETSYKVVVERRIKELEKDRAKAFYAFFSDRNPSPDDPLTEPNDGGSTSSLEIPEDLLLLDAAADTDDSPSGDAPTDDTPKDGGPSLGTPGDDPADDGDEAKSDAPKDDGDAKDADDS